MSQQIPRSQIRLAAEDSNPIVMDVETAVDEMYEALSNERRRVVLRELLGESAPMALDALARRVATREGDGEASASSDVCNEVRTSLYHTHLPKLDALDLVAFDPAERSVDSVTDAVSSVPV